jgi:hypothetical protein
VALAVIAILARYRHVIGAACANEVLAEIASPDDRRAVIVFERTCGATTGFSTQASLLRKGTPLPNEAGNLFIADSGHGAAPANPGGGPALEVIWRSPQSLLLRPRPKARVFKAMRDLDGVHVTYGEATDTEGP